VLFGTARGRALSSREPTAAESPTAHDSEKVVGTLASGGYRQVPAVEEADPVLYNVCAIRDKAPLVDDSNSDEQHPFLTPHLEQHLGLFLLITLSSPPRARFPLIH
jgi:hypothetical protein